MNILKILGIVVAVHVVAFFLMFVNPGCRSTAQGSAPVPSDTVAATATPAGGTSAQLPAAAPAVSVDFSAPAVVRYSPIRPGSAAAQALGSAPPADVTPATTYTVAAGDSLWSIAKKHGTTVTELARANKLTSNSRLSIGQKLIIPGKTPAAAAGGGVSESVAGATYVVKPGDTLSGIAHRVGSTPADIRRANNLTSDYVRVGQELRLPAESASATVAPSAGAPAASSAPAKKPEGSVVHVVKPGETLGAIARKYQVKVSDLAVVNNIADPKKIRPGQELVIPGFTAVGSAAPAMSAANPPAAASATAAPAPAGATPAPTNVPAPDQDLDAGLKPQDNVPVIKIEDSNAPKAP
jgi:LysM repeat protein